MTVITWPGQQQVDFAPAVCIFASFTHPCHGDPRCLFSTVPANRTVTFLSTKSLDFSDTPSFTCVYLDITKNPKQNVAVFMCFFLDTVEHIPFIMRNVCVEYRLKNVHQSYFVCTKSGNAWKFCSFFLGGSCDCFLWSCSCSLWPMDLCRCPQTLLISAFSCWQYFWISLHFHSDHVLGWRFPKIQSSLSH